MTTMTTILVWKALIVLAVGVLLQVRFVRQLRQAQQDLVQSQERLSLILRSSGIAVWSWHILQNVITPDENCSVVFGLPPGQFPQTVEEFTALVHPDDRERIQREVSACVEQGADYKTEFRIVTPAGAVRCLASRAQVYGEGQRRHLTGVDWDVTDHHLAEENLRATNEKLEQSLRTLERHKEQSNLLSEMADLLQACSSSTEAYGIIGQFCAHLFPNQAGALYIYSASRNLVNKVATWNDPLLDEASFGPDDCWALRRGQPHIIEPGHCAAPCHHLQNTRGGHACLPLMAQGAGVGIMYLQVKQNAGSQAPAEFLNPEDRQLASNVTEQLALSLANLRLQEALRLQTIRDPLTGLFNRRYLEETVERELYRMTRREQPAGFVMMDLDHFKAFNDTFGHAGGDALLHAFGKFLREHLRAEDIACRYGGEEFCVLFCEASLEDTVRLAEQLRSKVKQLAVQHEGQHLGAVTISMGIASYPMHGSTISELIAVADNALYQAKTEGRDRIVTAAAKSTASATPGV